MKYFDPARKSLHFMGSVHLPPETAFLSLVPELRKRANLPESCQLRLWDFITSTRIDEINVNRIPKDRDYLTGDIIIYQKASDTLVPPGAFPEYEAPPIPIAPAKDDDYIRKLWQTGKLSDCTIVCASDQTEFPAHRVILCRPAYFDRALLSTFSEAGEPQTRFTLPEQFTSSAVAVALRYIYEGDTALTSAPLTVLVDVLPLADFLSHDTLLHSCKPLIRFTSHPDIPLALRCDEVVEFMQVHREAYREFVEAVDGLIRIRSGGGEGVCGDVVGGQ
ncbi:hypothetical protein HK104_010117 [Borealophlyctis nickersoniae]|nr:hypothetical protein HK104_010117 [Borealophlyctis nickersoniae]